MIFTIHQSFYSAKNDLVVLTSLPPLMSHKPPCRNFAISGTCIFGKKCRFDHYTETPLVDPPTWIFTHFTSTKLNEYSYEEMRASLYLSCLENKQDKFIKFYDQAWLENYKNLSDKLTLMCQNGIVSSDSDRIVDFRKTPEVFCKPFNENLLIEAKEQCENEPMEVEDEKMWNNSEGNLPKGFNDGNERLWRRNDGKKYEDRFKKGYGNGRDDNRGAGKDTGYGKYERTSGEVNMTSNDFYDARDKTSGNYESKNGKKEDLNSLFESDYKKQE